MKRTMLIVFFLGASFVLWGQVDGLLGFNQTRLQKQKTGMLILGGWALGNMAVGGALVGNAEGVSKSFHTMNIGWNVVNLGLAAAGYFQAIKSDPASFDLYASFNETQKLQKILLFNGGLDVGYMLGGAYLIERSKNSEQNADRLKGFGQSIILQGAFLFVFDIVNYAVHASHSKQLEPIINSLSLSPNHIGLHLHF